MSGLSVWDLMFLFSAIAIFGTIGNSNSASGFPWCGAKSTGEQSQHHEKTPNAWNISVVNQEEAGVTSSNQSLCAGVKSTSPVFLPENHKHTPAERRPADTRTGNTNLRGGQHGVFVQAEDGVSHDGFIGQKAAAHHLWEEVTSVRFPVVCHHVHFKCSQTV